MARHSRDQKWYSLAEQASKETDPEKLQILVAQLCSALDEHNEAQSGSSGLIIPQE
jgi:hypothetical protein